MHLIKLEKDKSISPPTTITYFLNPDYVYIPVKNIIVKENELVYKWQMVSENIYSPVSGKVLGIKKCNVLNKKQNTLVIENDFREMNKEKDKKKIKLNIPNLLKLIEENPRLFNKLKSSKTFDTIIVSNINDNPYVYNKIFLLKENIDDILELIESLSIIYKSDNNLLIIKNNEAFIIDECLKVIGTYPKIKLTLVNDEYLLENERYLTEKLSLKNNCLYLTVEDILEINDLLKANISTTMIITVSGNAIFALIIIMPWNSTSPLLKKNRIIYGLITSTVGFFLTKYISFYTGMIISVTIFSLIYALLNNIFIKKSLKM